MDKLKGSYTRNNKSASSRLKSNTRLLVNVPDISDLPTLSEMYNSTDIPVEKSKNKMEILNVAAFIMFVLFVAVIMYFVATRGLTYTDEVIDIPI